MPNRRAWGTLNQRTAAAMPPVATAPDVLFGANLWAWYQPSGIASSGSNVTTWQDDGVTVGTAAERYLVPIGTAPTTTTINSVAAVNFLVSANGALQRTSTSPNVNMNLAGKTQITIFAVASFRSPTMAYGGFCGYGSSNTANSYDAGSSWLGVQRDNATNALFGAKDAGAAGPAISITPETGTDLNIYRFCTVWSGTQVYFYINNVIQTGYPVAFTAALAGTGPPSGLERFIVGGALTVGAQGFLWDGKIGELVMIVDDVPTDYERGSYDLYLKNKFGL